MGSPLTDFMQTVAIPAVSATDPAFRSQFPPRLADEQREQTDFSLTIPSIGGRPWRLADTREKRIRQIFYFQMEHIGPRSTRLTAAIGSQSQLLDAALKAVDISKLPDQQLARFAIIIDHLEAQLQVVTADELALLRPVIGDEDALPSPQRIGTLEEPRVVELPDDADKDPAQVASKGSSRWRLVVGALATLIVAIGAHQLYRHGLPFNR